MSAALLWVRLDLRRRARSLAVLAALVAITTAVVLTAVAGARRGQTALDRLLDRTKPATLAVLPNEPGFDWSRIEAIDGVDAVATFSLGQFVVDGVPQESVSFPFDARAMDVVERPVVLDGRLADPKRDDELVITPAFEHAHGVGVGDQVTLRLFSPEQADGLFGGIEPPPPEGPVIEATVVGEVRSPWFTNYGDVTDGSIIPSAGLLEQHRPNLVGADEQVFVNALVRLDDGAAGIADFREELEAATGRPDIEFFNLAEDAAHVRDVAGFEASALLAFAAAAGIAAVFLVGQSVVRLVAGATAELQVLRAIGMGPRQVRCSAIAGVALAAVAGALVGAIAAGLASSWFPIGTVSPFEPTPGRRLDGPVVVGGTVLVIVLITAGALVSSLVAERSFGLRSTRSSRLAGLAARAGAPVPAATGVRFALERGSGPQSVPVLPALVGSVVGVLGIVGALTFADGIEDATSTPERFGVFAELESYFGFNGQDFAPAEEVLSALAAHPDVAAVNDNRAGVAESGEIDVSLFTYAPVDGTPPIVVLDGRLPRSSDEVALAPTSADDLEVGVGDTFRLRGTKRDAQMTVSGLAFVPEGPHNDYDSGAWLTPDGFDALADGYKYHFADVTLREGVDDAAAVGRVDRDVVTALGDPEASEMVIPRPAPSRVAELDELQRLPLYLAAFLGILAVTAVGHAVATAVRRRRHDLAVLRAIGLTRGQTRRIALVQATVLAVVGLVIGVPLGIALGRSLWRSVAESTPVLHVTPLAALALALVAPVALFLANLLAAWPSHRAATLRVGQVLRTE